MKRGLRDQVAERLGTAIVAGTIAPGCALPPEATLLERYAVSRTVLREALNVLSGKGLIEAKPKRGTVVRPPSEWSHLDSDLLGWRDEVSRRTLPREAMEGLYRLMEMRRIVEPGAAALAARRATPADTARIGDAYRLMAEAEDSAEAFMEADLAFHVAILEAGRNDYLLPVAHAIRSSMMASLRITNRNPVENREVSLPLHRAIHEAIARRDGEAAATAMERHLDDTERRRARAGPRPA